MAPVYVVGRMPPPMDGQSLATERLAALLESQYDVRRFNTMPSRESLFLLGAGQAAATTRHYLRQRRLLRQTLRGAPAAPVLWCSISPAVLGHFRDVLASAPPLAGHPVCAVVHRGNFHEVFTRNLTRNTARRLARSIDLFVFLSRSLAGNAAQWIPEHKIRIVPNTIDDDAECAGAEVEKKQRARMRRTRVNLLFLSNMVVSKGYFDVLKAVEMLRARGHSVRARFAGRWNREQDRAAFQDRVNILGLKDVVTHLGPVTQRSAVKALHLEADVLLLPTYYENEAQPLAVIEALAAATPVVVTRHGSLPEMVRSGKEAAFVRRRCAEDIAAAVEGLILPDGWTAASKCARERYLEAFSPDAVRSKWCAIVEELAGPRGQVA